MREKVTLGSSLPPSYILLNLKLSLTQFTPSQKHELQCALRIYKLLAMVVYMFNPSICEAETDRSLYVPGQLGLPW